MNNFNGINNAQQRPATHQTSQAINNNGLDQQQFLGQVATQQYQPQFNANILQLLILVIQQLLQLIDDQQPEEPEKPKDQTLNPDDATRSKLADILGVPAETIKVTDRDGNGQLSAGDLVEGVFTNENGEDVAVRYELSDLALKDANGKLGSELPLDQGLNKTRNALNNVVGVISGVHDAPTASVIDKVLDSDGNGLISEGDVVAIRPIKNTAVSVPPFSLEYVELTADQVKQFENQAYGADLELPQSDLDRLATIRNDNGIHSRVFDTDGSGRVSAGDVLEVTGPRVFGDTAPSVLPYSHYIEITQDVADQFNQAVDNPPLPDTVSGGNVQVGAALGSGEIIPNERITTIEGRNYSVGFLKQQVDDYANSSYFNENAGVTTDFGQYAWGSSNSSSFGGAFERYISDTFPLGDPGVPANPPVRYEGRDTLIVNGQAYTSGQVPPGIVAPSSLSISTSSDSDIEAARELVNSFNDVQIVTEFSFINAFVVRVPADYLTQWRGALLDNLPAGASVNFDRGLTSPPGAPGESAPTA